MLESHFRARLQKILFDPAANVAAKYLTANQVTLLAFVLGVLVCPALIFSYNGLAVALLLLSGYLDALDGTVARLTGTSSDFGAILDIFCDRAVECAIIIGLFAIAPETRSLLCLLMLSSVLLVVTSFLLAGLFVPNQSEKSFNYTPSLMERPEAFTFFIAMILLPQFFSWLAAAFILLVLYTALLRMMETKKILAHD